MGRQWGGHFTELVNMGESIEHLVWREVEHESNWNGRSFCKFWLSVGFGLATGKLLAKRAQVPMNSPSPDERLRKFIELTKYRGFLVSAVRLLFSQRIFHFSVLSTWRKNTPPPSFRWCFCQTGWLWLSLWLTHAIKILSHYRLSC